MWGGGGEGGMKISDFYLLTSNIPPVQTDQHGEHIPHSLPNTTYFSYVHVVQSPNVSFKQ